MSNPTHDARRAITRGYYTMLGLDGTSVADAVEAAFTPTGPPRKVLKARIEQRRAALYQ